MNWYHLDGETLTGPYGYYSREVLAATGASNPDCLSDAEMRACGFIPEWREGVDAPLGWQPPAVETRDGEQWVAVYAAGTVEEREAETLRLWRESLLIPRWKGRACLANQSPVESGPLATFQSATLMDQIDAFVSASFSPVQRERYLGADPWHRNDPMITEMGTLLGLSDEQIDAWFITAGSFG